MSATPHSTEILSIDGAQLVSEIKRILHEGNVRRIRIKQAGHTLLEVPLTVGVVGVVLAPVLAAIGALAALITECSIEIERVEPPGPPPPSGPPAA
ncbi:MAG: DUF4342 domain-containing protein [Polyangia bacterium]